MLGEFVRIVVDSGAAWWWLENVPGVPDVRIPGYSWLRIPLDPRDFGARQRRPRHFQFGHRDGAVPLVTRRPRAAIVASRCCMASEASRPGRRGWADFCVDQGLPGALELPPFKLAARYAAVGNGVHLGVARAIAEATANLVPAGAVQLCACGCARVVGGRRSLATAACRKRVQRRRDASRAGGVTDQAAAPAAASQRPGDAPAGARPGPDTERPLELAAP